ncbi:TPA: hypothetical protein ACSTL0_001542 [Serratia fonticola]
MLTNEQLRTFISLKNNNLPDCYQEIACELLNYRELMCKPKGWMRNGIASNQPVVTFDPFIAEDWKNMGLKVTELFTNPF